MPHVLAKSLIHIPQRIISSFFHSKFVTEQITPKQDPTWVWMREFWITRRILFIWIRVFLGRKLFRFAVKNTYTHLFWLLWILKLLNERSRMSLSKLKHERQKTFTYFCMEIFYNWEINFHLIFKELCLHIWSSAKLGKQLRKTTHRKTLSLINWGNASFEPNNKALNNKCCLIDAITQSYTNY